MTVLIGQISDLHAKAGSASLGALHRAMAFLAAVGPDAVIVSGDLANRPHEQGYALVRDAFAALTCPILMVPGNADQREQMRAAFPETHYWPGDGPLHLAETVKGVRLIGLDVTVPGEKYGEVTAEVLGFLNRALADEPRAPALVFMHQHPFETFGGLDVQMCRNVDPLRAALDSAPVPVLGLACGHAHRAIITRFGRPVAMMCPSLEGANPVLTEGFGEPPITDPPGLMLHVIEGERLVSHTVSLG